MPCKNMTKTYSHSFASLPGRIFAEVAAQPSLIRSHRMDEEARAAKRHAPMVDMVASCDNCAPVITSS